MTKITPTESDDNKTTTDNHEKETQVASIDKSTTKAFPPNEASNANATIKKISDDSNLLLA